MNFIFDDGGRKAAGFKGNAGDCVIRAISIATGKPYREVYNAVNLLAKRERVGKHEKRSSARNGVHKETYHRYLKSIGWRWVPTMGIGTGCRMHLAEGELPMGKIIARLSKHLTVVIDGAIHDTSDPQRITHRCVYGYFVEGLK